MLLGLIGMKRVISLTKLKSHPKNWGGGGGGGGNSGHELAHTSYYFCKEFSLQFSIIAIQK